MYNARVDGYTASDLRRDAAEDGERMGCQHLYMDILLSAADEISQLRPGDVGRVLGEAADRGVRAGFREWLLDSSFLLTRTRQVLEAMEA